MQKDVGNMVEYSNKETKKNPIPCCFSFRGTTEWRSVASSQHHENLSMVSIFSDEFTRTKIVEDIIIELDAWIFGWSCTPHGL